MTNRLYDTLKMIAQLILPSLATLYAAIGGIWGLPMVEEVVGTLSAVDAFLGAILAYFKAKYDKEVQQNG